MDPTQRIRFFFYKCFFFKCITSKRFPNQTYHVFLSARYLEIITTFSVKSPWADHPVSLFKLWVLFIHLYRLAIGRIQIRNPSFLVSFFPRNTPIHHILVQMMRNAYWQPKYIENLNGVIISRIPKEICGKRGDHPLQDAHTPRGKRVPQRRRARLQAGRGHEENLPRRKAKEISSG